MSGPIPRASASWWPSTTRRRAPWASASVHSPACTPRHEPAQDAQRAIGQGDSIPVFRSSGEATTGAFGAALARALQPGDAVALSGPVGAGKSVLARAVIQSAQRQAGVAVEDVPSPSFTLVQVYDVSGRVFWHCDLYRLGDAGELPELGLEDAQPSAILLIEWPELILDDLGERYLDVRIAPCIDDAEGRQIHVTARGGNWDHLAPILADWTPV